MAEHKTVHAAAASLHLTQTAVTQRIRGLETKLNTNLFVRSRRGMLLTPEGEALLRYSYASRELEGETMAQIEGSGQKVTIELSISGPTSLMSSRIISQCVPVMEQFPNLLLHFDITDSENRARHLRNGQCQLAIIQPENLAKEMENKQLKPEEYILLCSPKWKGRPLKKILQQEYIIDYNPDDTMTFQYLKHFDLYDLAQHQRHFVNRTESLANLIAAGLGYGLLTKEFSKPYIKNKQLMVLNAGKSFKHDMCLAWYSRPNPPAYFSALIKTIS